VTMENKLRSILLIDDDEPTNFLNRRLLEGMHCADKVQVIQKAPEALEYLKKITEQENDEIPFPDIIFLDINMPAMDGWEFLESFREIISKRKKKVRLVMLTTSINPEDEQKARESEFVTAFRNKPLSRDMVKEILKHNDAA
jgi:CheY-like chemotaxis protein